MPLGTSNVLLLIYAILTFWISCARGQEACDMPLFENARARSDGTWFKLNDTLDYVCRDGYESRGGHTTGSIVCGNDGWSDTPMCYGPYCFFRECSIPQIGRYLNVEPKKDRYKVGDVLKFSCRQRLVRVGAESVQCYHFGWSPDFPTCRGRVQSCGPPPQLPSGEVKETQKEEYGHGEVVEYVCNPGFLLKGLNKIQCVDGQWTSLPVCIEKESTCGDVPDLDHGYVQTSAPPYNHGDSVEFSCREAFTMIGHRSITCIRGRWTQLPQCIATDELQKCKLSRLISHDADLSDKIEFNHNTNISFKCKGKHKHSICINGRWDPEVTCTEVEKQLCPPPPQIPNAQDMTTTVNYRDGEKISIVCQEKYLIQGVEEIVCKDGRWQSIPHCVERECSIPQIGRYLNVEPKKDRYIVGDVLKFSCRQRLVRVGADSVQCYHFGWSPDFPTCKGQVQSCGPPPSLPSGEVKETRNEEYGHGEVVEYVCNPGFLLKGPNKIQCVDGQWTTLPICIEVESTCGDVPDLDHGYVQPSAPPYHHGDSVEFSCREAFTMIGHRSITCIRGRWTELPQCIATDELDKCKLSTLIPHDAGLSDKTEFNHNTKVSYKCKGKYKHSICINGRWDPEVTCTEVQIQSCPPPPQIPNAQDMTTTVNYQDGDKISVLCQEKYLIQGAEEIVCKDGRWQSIPRCMDA